MGLSINIDTYYRQRKASQDYFYLQGAKNIEYTCSTLSASTMVPIIVLYCWIAELEGFDQKTIDKIKMLIDFYDYVQVLNPPINWPVELTQYLEI